MSDIIGRKIVNVRRMTLAEAKKEGWDDSAFPHRVAPVLVLDDGSKIYPSEDEEGNGVGMLFGSTKRGKMFYVTPPPRSMRDQKQLKKVM